MLADPERDPVWQSMSANRPAIDGSIEVSSTGLWLVLDEGNGTPVPRRLTRPAPALAWREAR